MANSTKNMQHPTLSTVNDLFFRVVSAANPRAILWQDEFGLWQPISSDQIYQRVRALAQAFLGWGMKKGDRIALISENRWEWAVTDFAALAIGAIDVPIYTTLTGEQIAALIADAGCRIAVVSTRQQFDKLNAVRWQTSLERILIMDSAAAPDGAIAFSEVIAGADERGAEHDQVFDALAHAAEPIDPATLIYTSGTTGEPKGVVLTHGNFAANQNIAPLDFGFTPADALISFLPLSHVTARALDYIMYLYGVQVAYCSKFDKLPEAMRQIRPTVFVGVPRVFEKIRQEIERRAGLSPIKKRLLAWAIGVGASHSDTVYDGRRPSSPLWKLADKLAYSKVREAFGGRVRIFVPGGAPLGIDTAKWFAAVGIPLWEGYGLTETSPVIALNTPITHRIGSIGKPISNVEVGGKMVAPQPIENKLMNSSLVAQAALVGDKHKFISTLISPNFTALEEWARQHGIEAKDHAELVADIRVVALYAEIVREVNGRLAKFESLKRFRVVPHEWSIETGELTPSMKLKRRVISERYAALIAELYEDEATSSGELDR